MPVLDALVSAGHEVTPILSESVRDADTRFGTAAGWREQFETICGRKALDSQVAVEPVGPKKLFDALVVAPCTGNTLAKLANGISDSTVTLACKAHLRNGRPLLLALSTNDALSGNAGNIGTLMARRNIYFVPLRQDDAAGKPSSAMSDFTKIPESLALALEGRQQQPLLTGPQR